MLSVYSRTNSQDGSSEEFLGEWMEERGNREQIVLATKVSELIGRSLCTQLTTSHDVFQYTTNYMRTTQVAQKTHYVGNNLKSLHLSVNSSLKKLRTDYIDILYVHWWDYTCGVEEVMNGLHNLVTQGKVLYLGISDTPAWIVSKANTYARMAGKTPFIIYQGQWSIMHRDFERDILPMAIAEGKHFADTLLRRVYLHRGCRNGLSPVERYRRRQDSYGRRRAEAS